MLDSTLKPLIDPYLNKTANTLATIGIGPNQITLYGFIVGLVGCVAIGLQSYVFGLFLILLNRLADGLDGAVARSDFVEDSAQSGEEEIKEVKKTVRRKFGAYLDVILDMVLFGAFVFMFALGQPDHALTAGFLLFSFIGLFATSLGGYLIDRDPSANKAFFHPAKLIEDTEITIFIILVSLNPAAFSALAVLFGILCWVTAISRIWQVFWDLRTGN